MKQLLAMLIRRGQHPWWELRISEGDPPDERIQHHILPALLAIIRSRLTYAKGRNETAEKTDGP